jgi:hypothetical protein
VTQRMPPVRLTAGTMRGLLVSLAGACIPGRAARGSISHKKATCQVPAKRAFVWSKVAGAR